MTPERLGLEQALPRMQALASRLWSPEHRHHPGQLAWSAAYGEPEVLDLGPAFLLDHAWAWLESLDWLEVCGTDRAAVEAVVAAALAEDAADEVTASTLETESVVIGVLQDHGFTEAESPWFTHHLLDLADLPDVSLPAGYDVRAVRPDEAEQRAAVHRAAWSPTSRVTTAAYARLMTVQPYRPELDHVVVAPDGEWVASCCVWLDTATGAALVEPVSCVEEHCRKGLATAASVSALTAARDAGATTGLVCPRGDDDYPGPARLYQRIGFAPGARTRLYRRRRDG